MDPDPYALLAVTSDATAREIDDARRYADRVLAKMSRGLEPDVVTAKSAQIEQAWKTLRDPAARGDLDDQRSSPAATETSVSSQFSRADGQPGKVCALCTAAPAMTMHFRVRRSRRVVDSVSGPFCRACGIATFRDASNRTLRQGFWRARTIIATLAIIQGNWRERRRIDVLKPSDDTDLSLDPGRPLWLRSGVVAVAITLSLVALSLSQAAGIGSMLSGKHALLNELKIP